MKLIDMRNAIKERYSERIRGQLVDNMPESQVTAIYNRLVDWKDPLLGKRKVPKKMQINKPVRYEQTKMEL